jgi:3-oxoadipate enol-lactonase
MTGTVVLCGSLGSTAAMWDTQRRALAGRKVVRLEYPGHGDQPLRSLDGIDDLAAQAAAAVDGPFAFVGLSLGGAVGMRVAAEHPGRVERLVLACTSPRFGEAAQWHERAALVRSKGLAAIVDAVLARWFAPGFGEEPAYREMFLSVDPEGYARCCEVLAGWDGAADLARVSCPTLVIAGADDPVSPPRDAMTIAAQVASARVEVIDGAHHLANVERPETFNRLLEEWV